MGIRSLLLGQRTLRFRPHRLPAGMEFRRRQHVRQPFRPSFRSLGNGDGRPARHRGTDRRDFDAPARPARLRPRLRHDGAAESRPHRSRDDRLPHVAHAERGAHTVPRPAADSSGRHRSHPPPDPDGARESRLPHSAGAGRRVVAGLLSDDSLPSGDGSDRDFFRPYPRWRKLRQSWINDSLGELAGAGSQRGSDLAGSSLLDSGFTADFAARRSAARYARQRLARPVGLSARRSAPAERSRTLDRPATRRQLAEPFGRSPIDARRPAALGTVLGRLAGFVALPGRSSPRAARDRRDRSRPGVAPLPRRGQLEIAPPEALDRVVALPADGASAFPVRTTGAAAIPFRATGTTAFPFRSRLGASSIPLRPAGVRAPRGARAAIRALGSPAAIRIEAGSVSAIRVEARSRAAGNARSASRPRIPGSRSGASIGSAAGIVPPTRPFASMTV